MEVNTELNQKVKMELINILNSNIDVKYELIKNEPFSEKISQETLYEIQQLVNKNSKNKVVSSNEI